MWCDLAYSSIIETINLLLHAKPVFMPKAMAFKPKHKNLQKSKSKKLKDKLKNI